MDNYFVKVRYSIFKRSGSEGTYHSFIFKVEEPSIKLFEKMAEEELRKLHAWALKGDGPAETIKIKEIDMVNKL